MNFSKKITGVIAAIGLLLSLGTATHAQDKAAAEKARIAAWEAEVKPALEEDGKLLSALSISKPDSVERAKILARRAEIKKIRLAQDVRLIEDLPNSDFSTSVIYSNYVVFSDYTGVKTLYDKLGPVAKQSTEGKKIADNLVILLRIQNIIGKPIYNFTLDDINGKPVSIADFKGKYVLLDFWASWCHNCREANPFLLKAYNEYKDKGFTIVSVASFDLDDRWRKAVAADKLPWTQLADFKKKNEVATYYGITGVPYTLLIDPRGIVVDKELDKTLLSEKIGRLVNSKTIN